MSHWQYQGLAKPLEPTLTEAPPELSWFQPASEPTRTHLPRPHGGLSYDFEPSLFVTPSMETWWRPTEMPPPGHKPRQGEGVKDLEPIAEAITSIDWWHQQQLPYGHLPRPRGGTDAPLEPSLIVAPPELSWWRPTETRPSPVSSRRAGSSGGFHRRCRPA